MKIRDNVRIKGNLFIFRLNVERAQPLCQDEFMAIIERPVNVYETDMMGIVHHSNYLRFCEEARVAWCDQRQLLNSSRDGVFSLTVVETRVKHKSPVAYGDRIRVDLQVKAHGARVAFQYKVLVAERVCALVETVHCSLDQKFNVLRLRPELIEKIKESPWTETWL